MKLVVNVILLLALQQVPVNAQGIDDLTLDKRFECQVKSLAEFLARLNGEESFPGVEQDERFRINNIAALMDYQMPYDDKQIFHNESLKFIKALEQYPHKIYDTDSLLFAKAKCRILIKGKECDLCLILKKEKDEKGFLRWAIAGADGLQECGLIDTTSKRGISPVEHEIHFMELIDILKNDASHMMEYRSSQAKIDQLTAFLILSQMKKIELLSINKVTYYVFTIPNYVFTIDEIARTNFNSGWLISSYMNIQESEKKEHVKKLLGK